MKIHLQIVQFLLSIIFFTCAFSVRVSAQNQISQAFTPCAPSTAQTDLDIGNVRATIWMNGDMWWDHVGNAQYFVPKNSGLCPLFAGAIWFGGNDAAGQLKVAAQTYRQSGSDFWPGPVDTLTTSTTAATCLAYDRHWKITRQEVADFLNGNPATQSIIDWPGNGGGNYPHYLAPYVDVNADGIYNYLDGDYPAYDFGTLGSISMYNKLSGDQTVFWIFNDIGNIHMETNSLYPIGLEIYAQAYAFCTSDSDLMNTTFYNYKIINRSSMVLQNAYMGQWVDADLGNYIDDYVGCDVGRDLGFAYNGDNDDDGPLGYGTNLAAVGVDILAGLKADSADGVDNNRNQIVDEVGEDIRMTNFMYYDNNGTNHGSPANAQEYYNYLRSVWRDNTSLCYGGNGYQVPGADSSLCMFPGNSDPNNYGTRGIPQSFLWTEEEPTGPGSIPNVPGDRRLLISSGRFSFQPGQVQSYSTAAVFARSSNGITASVTALKAADDRIQSFFDSQFTNIPTCAVHIGIDEVNSNFQLLIYPSPSSSQLSMQIPDGEKIDCTIRIFDALGKEIKSLETKNRTEISLSVADWVPGIYYYSIKSHKGQMIGGKFLVIH